MPLFTITGRDREDGFALRAATRDAHLAWIAEAGAHVKVGGPWLDSQARSIGSLLIVDFPDLAAAEAWAAQDPYVAAGLFDVTAVGAWRLVAGDFAP